MKRQGNAIRGNKHEKSSLPAFLFHPRRTWVLIRKSVGAWVDDYASSMSAALASYTLFAIAPLLIIAIAAARLVFGHEVARGEIIAQIQGLIGREGAIAVQSLLKSTNEPAQNLFATPIWSRPGNQPIFPRSCARP
jgi:membrane protein